MKYEINEEQFEKIPYFDQMDLACLQLGELDELVLSRLKCVLKKEIQEEVMVVEARVLRLYHKLKDLIYPTV